jgi:hypothetical protein
MWRHLAPQAIVVIDDLNFDSVRQGTADGFEAVDGGSAGSSGSGGGGCVAVGGVVVAAFERRMTRDGSHTPLAEAAEGYWNGVGVYVIDKTRAAVAAGAGAVALAGASEASVAVAGGSETAAGAGAGAAAAGLDESEARQA